MNYSYAIPLPFSLVDGTTNTLGYEFTSYTNAPYFLIDLGMKYDLTSIKFFWGPVLYAIIYGVSTSPDNITWTTNLNVTGNTNNTSAGDSRVFSTSPTAVRYIKIFNFSSSDNTAFKTDLFEIQVFGTISPNQTSFTTGNVGIGTSTPLNKLHVIETTNGWTSRIENNGCIVYSAYGAGATDGYGMHIRVNSKRSDRYALQVFDGTNSLLYVRNDGKVGIGTSTPYEMLSVNGNVSASKFIDFNNGIYYIAPANTTTSINVGGNVLAPKFSDINNPSYYLDPASTTTSLIVAGRVGIGCAAPTVPLAVNGKIQAIELELKTAPCADYYSRKITN